MQSARSDASDLEQHVETLMELKKLERSYRIMEKDRKAYTQESQVHIGKQRYGDVRSAIGDLRKDPHSQSVCLMELQEGDHRSRTRTRGNPQRSASHRKSLEPKQERK